MAFALLLGHFNAQAAAAPPPLLPSLESNQRASGEPERLAIANLWQSAVFGAIALPEDKALDPEQIWAWDGSKFNQPGAPKTVFLKSGERFFARFSLPASTGAEIVLELTQPKLDAVHVSYRYPGMAWKTLSSGDRIAMSQWAWPDRHPSFILDTKRGAVDVVLQIAHKGTVHEAAQISGEKQYVLLRHREALLNGFIISICFLMTFVGILGSINNRNESFLAVSLLSAMMGLMLFFNSGEAGLWVLTDYSHFNDQSKHVTTILQLMSIPLAMMLALNLRLRAPRWWLMGLAFVILGLLFAPVRASYEWRELSILITRGLVVTVLALIVWLLYWTWQRGLWGNRIMMIGLIAHAFLPLLIVGSITGRLTAFTIDQIMAALSLLASIFLIRGLFIRHSQGRQVLTQSRVASGRDLLTGLHNANGLRYKLNQLRQSNEQYPQNCLLIYLRFDNKQLVSDSFGEDGLNAGLVQIAANLVTNLGDAHCISRISRNEFVCLVYMKPHQEPAQAIAQKLASSLMIMGERTTPLASDFRIALAWLPLYGYDVEDLRKRGIQTVEDLPNGKRVGWFDGICNELEALEALKALRQGSTLSPPPMLDRIVTSSVPRSASSRPPTSARTKPNDLELTKKINELEKELFQKRPSWYMTSKKHD